MQSLAVYLYVTAVGFVAAGVLASFVQLVSGEPMRFGDRAEIAAGLDRRRAPARDGRSCHLMRNAWRGLQAPSAAQDLVRPVGGHRGGVEPVFRRGAARSDR